MRRVSEGEQIGMEGMRRDGREKICSTQHEDGVLQSIVHKLDFLSFPSPLTVKG